MAAFHETLAPLARVVDSANERIGRAVSWTALVLVIVQFIAVVLRYVFGAGWIWVEESIVYLHATLFMAGSAYTLLHDGHVRVDIFYRGASTRQRAWIDLLGTALFLWPVCVLIFVKGWPYVASSWSILEGSQETSGIPAVFLLKSLILMFAAMMIVQGISIAASAALELAGRGKAGA
jgi:TRAP-type mannitol/chloroaromatic compound transport system permease small subunit